MLLGTQPTSSKSLVVLQSIKLSLVHVYTYEILINNILVFAVCLSAKMLLSQKFHQNPLSESNSKKEEPLLKLNCPILG